METTKNYLNCTKGWRSWLFTQDHKRIAILYLIGISISFLLGGLFAMAIRFELLTPDQFVVGSKTFNQLFTLHGAIMVLLVIIPAIPAILGNFVLPLMVGAKDVAFPKVNLLSWYFYMAGVLLALYHLTTGAVDTGWTFYTPYSISTNTSVITVGTAAFLVGISSILTGINFIATIHMMRIKGMGWFKMPLLLWAFYSTAVIQIVATPVLGITLLLLVVERVAHIGIFDPALGGDPVLFQHFFWFYSHPAVYIMVLPAMGVISEIIPTFCRKKIFGYKFIAYSSIAIALISFLVWGHHLYVSGQSAFASMVFGLLTFLVAIPSGIKVFNWIATMYKGAIDLKSPFLYVVSFLILFTIGGLTGIVNGTLSLDLHLHDTYFIVSHFHYTMMGGVLIAFIAGLHYWWPKMFGKMYSERLARITCGLLFLGFNITFISQFILGTRGMPRRYHNYLPEFQSLHIISSIGAFIVGLAFFMMLYYLIDSLFRGKKAPNNPWGGTTLEWQASSPPVTENFDQTPEMRELYKYKSKDEL